MHVASVDVERYLVAMVQSGNTDLNIGDKWSWKAKGMLKLAVRTAILILPLSS